MSGVQRVVDSVKVKWYTVGSMIRKEVRLRIISDYLLTRESVESDVCPLSGSDWETSMRLFSKLSLSGKCGVESLVLVVLILRGPLRGCRFIC